MDHVSNSSNQPKETYEWLAANVFLPSCVGCHEPGASNGVDLTSREGLLDSDVVTFYDLGRSSLYQSVATGKMPKKASKLSAEKIAAIADWILAGAP